MSRLAAEKIVFVYDQTTDLRLLGNCLTGGWERGGTAWRPAADLARSRRENLVRAQLLMRRLLEEQPRRVLAVADLTSA